ncbi:MAG: MFS transporter, partial [Beijerinckiaceae bacterium]
ALLAPHAGGEFGVSLPVMFAIMSAALLIGGFFAPMFGRQMDRRGAPVVMAAGSLACGLSFAALAFAPDIRVFAALIVLAEVISGAVLYDAAFATLVQARGAKAKTSITHLTLIAAFASTLFWPLTGWLTESFGWRNACLVFAALHIGVALPAHVWLRAQVKAQAGAAAREVALAGAVAPAPPIDEAFRRRAFIAVAVSFAIGGALISAIAMHLVPVLQALGLGASAYVASMFMGPAQMAIRLIDAVFWRGFHPVTVAIVSATAMPLAIAALVLGGSGFWVAAGFAVLFGVGQGLSSIVRGTVPLAIFGAEGFGARQGQLALIRTLLSAASPFVFSLGMATVGVQAALVSVAAIGLLALLPLLWLQAQVKVQAKEQAATV